MMTGDKKVKANLAAIQKRVSKDETQGLIEIGERGVGLLKGNTPVIEGRLRGSMSYTTDNKVVKPLWSGKNKSGDELRKSRSDKTVIIGTNVIYAARVEYLARNGSAGFMLRSYKQLKPLATKIMKQVFKRKGF